MSNFKSVSLLLTAILFSGIAFSQSSFRVNGKIVGLRKGGLVSLVNTEGNQVKELAKTNIENGTFVINGVYNKPMMCDLNFYCSSVKDKTKNVKVATLRLILEKDPITITMNSKDLLSDSLDAYKESKAIIKGGKMQDEYNEYKKMIRQQEIKSILAGYAEANAWFNNNGNDDAIQSYKQKDEVEKAKLQVQKDEFIRQYPNYAVSAYLTTRNMLTFFTYTKEEIQSMADRVKDNSDTARVHWIQRNLSKLMLYSKNVRFTDFTGLTPDSTHKKLSECMVPETYTLLDFWASWCGPCRAAIGKVKALGETYKGKLTVISASVDEKEVDWRKAEKEENMPWAQLLIPKEELAKTVAQAYMIESIPRLVLINPQGEILFVSYSPAQIAAKLKEEIAL
jgi:thiol-disulfide isomerase/thioredoxin